MNSMRPGKKLRLAIRAIAWSAGLAAIIFLAYPIVRFASNSRIDFVGQDAVDYILLHGSVSSHNAAPPHTASVVDGVSVPASSFTDVMVDKLLDLPNLQSISISTSIAPDPPVSGRLIERPLQQMDLPASDAAIAKLRARFPRLATYSHAVPQQATEEGG